MGFSVSLTGTGLTTDGVVRCDQVRTIDLRARGGRRIETAPDHVIDEVLGKVATLLE